MRRALVALALAAVATGLALSLILIGNGPGASGLVGGHYWIVVFVCASVVVGWLAAQLIRTPLIALLSPAAVLVVIGIVMFVKLLRFPNAPLVGDGFAFLVAWYVLCGFTATALGQTPRFRAISPTRAIRAGLLLIALVALLSVLPYGLGAIIGS